jgi:hypothetical protein
VLYCQKHLDLSEEVLLRYIPEDEDGNSLAEIAQAAFQLGYVPRMRCLTGQSGLIGNVPQDLIQEGSEAELREWLQQTLVRYPVMVSLNTRGLPPPYEEGLHSVVVVTIDGDRVEYLEPDPPEQNTYPKRAEYKFLDLVTFMNAWRLIAYLAFYIEE